MCVGGNKWGEKEETEDLLTLTTMVPQSVMCRGTRRWSSRTLDKEAAG